MIIFIATSQSEYCGSSNDRSKLCETEKELLCRTFMVNSRVLWRAHDGGTVTFKETERVYLSFQHPGLMSEKYVRLAKALTGRLKARQNIIRHTKTTS